MVGAYTAKVHLYENEFSTIKLNVLSEAEVKAAEKAAKEAAIKAEKAAKAAREAAIKAEKAEEAAKEAEAVAEVAEVVAEAVEATEAPVVG